jgi:hypothetical protein
VALLERVFVVFRSTAQITCHTNFELPTIARITLQLHPHTTCSVHITMTAQLVGAPSSPPPRSLIPVVLAVFEAGQALSQPCKGSRARRFQSSPVQKSQYIMRG